MTIPVFGLQAIKDKATRDAIYQLAQRAGTGDGSGGVAVDVQSNDPASDDPGTEGDIIYATGTESIWIFTGTSWERASSGTDGVIVEVRSYTDSSAAQSDPADWVAASTIFKNDSGTRMLAIHVFEGTVELTQARYNAATYNWYKNGVVFTANSSIQANGTGSDNRRLIINANDVADAGTDIFVCEIDYT